MKVALNDFEKVYKHTFLIKNENAVRIYADLKEDYILWNASLTSLGVNLTDIDKIKE